MDVAFRSVTEQLPYEVVRRLEGAELRRYPAHAVAEVTVRASFEDAGSIAFKALFGYISGQNRSRRSVAMTAPVVQRNGPSEKVAMTAPVVQTGSAQEVYVVAFVLPATLTVDTAPQPTNADVHLRTVPAHLAVAVRYSGRWSRSAYERHLAQLRQAMAAHDLTPAGPPRYLRYDPPFKPWFLRRNEIVVDVSEDAPPQPA
jgi:hypothetical protein